MPLLARAPASLRRPGALQQGGALYCACERQRATGATTHQAKSHPETLPCNKNTQCKAQTIITTQRHKYLYNVT
ncbi:hypothetical protein F0955_19435 [Salmonella enterica]|nr:hypothetical protein [Salmonella enterica]